MSSEDSRNNRTDVTGRQSFISSKMKQPTPIQEIASKTHMPLNLNTPKMSKTDMITQMLAERKNKDKEPYKKPVDEVEPGQKYGISRRIPPKLGTVRVHEKDKIE